MDTPLVFTPADVVQLITKITALIVGINAAAIILVNLYRHARQPEENQNEKIRALEDRVDSLEKGQKHMEENFEESRMLIRAIEKDNQDFRRVVVKGIQALTEHAINGDSSAALNASTEAINDYLLRSKDPLTKEVIR